MNTQDPRHEITKTEREFVGLMVHRGFPPELRLPAETLRDEKAREVFKVAVAISSAQGSVSIVSVTDHLIRANAKGDLRAPIADLIEIAGGGDQPDPENLREFILEEYQKRQAEAEILRAARAVEGGADPCGVLANLQSHHLVSFGSSGSLSLEPPDPPKPFPIDALGLLPSAFASEVSRVAMVPGSLSAASVLGILSAAIGASFRIETYKGTLGANLFILVIADSGTGKDSALNLVGKRIDEIDEVRTRVWEEETKPDLFADLREVKAKLKAFDSERTGGEKNEAGQRREDLRALERKRIEIEAKLEAVPTLTVGDITKEALALALASQPNEALASRSAEARGILKVIAGRYSKASDEDIYTGGFSGTPSKTTRLSRPTIILKRPCLSILWMVQNDSFREFLGNEAMTESGLFPRCLAFDSKAEPAEVPEEVEPVAYSVEREWSKLIDELIAVREGDPRTVKPDKRASEMLRAYDNEKRKRRRSGGDLKDVSPYAARWPENAWKVALVLHVAEHSENAARVLLSEATAANAIRIVEWFAEETLLLLEGNREARRRNRRDGLRALLSGAEGRTMTLRDLAKSHGFPTEEIEEIGKKCHWLQIAARQNPKGGPRSRVATLLE